ncbi:MAG: sigma-70 family RNA polymerase sigma factor [Bacteroidaceae bacterium]|nr:sigma-70 family RNA polymerase sigma factor [Bacteroidaceae bacterium]
MELNTLIQRAKEKDPSAFDILYRTYYPKMMGLCMNITRDDRSTAGDLVHDAFILAFASIGSLRDNTKFSEWLASIVRNVALQYVRQRDRFRVLPLSAISEEDAVPADSSSLPDADLSYKELLELVSLLPEGYSRILRLSVIDGFSHKEIADMLGIAPHSSSSQLSRARRLLKRLLEKRAVGIIMLLLVPLVGYYMFRSGSEVEDVGVANPSEQPVPTWDEAPLAQQDSLTPDSLTPDSLTPDPSPRRGGEHRRLAEEKEERRRVADSLTPDPDSVASLPNAQTLTRVAPRRGEEHRHVAEDSVRRSVTSPTLEIMEPAERRERSWQLTASGSLGSALAQNAHRLLAINASGMPEPDGPGLELPSHVSTWEEYAHFLKAFASPYVTDDTLTRIEIADHNTGRIEQQEHHDKPVTFALSVQKSLSGRWSLETGVQYSLLSSRFSMGENGYNVRSRQRIHYLGVPLRMSCRWMEHKRLAAYSSAGAVMHIPVYGTMHTSYLVNWQSRHSTYSRLAPPLQWQLGAAVGVQYRLSPRCSLFAEPTFNWFIPMGSEIHTAWTERPVMVTCPLGIRFTW